MWSDYGMSALMFVYRAHHPAQRQLRYFAQSWPQPPVVCTVVSYNSVAHIAVRMPSGGGERLGLIN